MSQSLPTPQIKTHQEFWLVWEWQDGINSKSLKLALPSINLDAPTLSISYRLSNFVQSMILCKNARNSKFPLFTFLINAHCHNPITVLRGLKRSLKQHICFFYLPRAKDEKGMQKNLHMPKAGQGSTGRGQVCLQNYEHTPAWAVGSGHVDRREASRERRS